jgi:hypothetical protein
MPGKVTLSTLAQDTRPRFPSARAPAKAALAPRKSRRLMVFTFHCLGHQGIVDGHRLDRRAGVAVGSPGGPRQFFSLGVHASKEAPYETLVRKTEGASAGSFSGHEWILHLW